MTKKEELPVRGWFRPQTKRHYFDFEKQNFSYGSADMTAWHRKYKQLYQEMLKDDLSKRTNLMTRTLFTLVLLTILAASAHSAVQAPSVSEACLSIAMILFVTLLIITVFIKPKPRGFKQ